MARIIKKENANIIVGVVTNIRKGENVTNLSMTLNGWDAEKKEATKSYLQLAGWDNSFEQGAWANIPERLEKAKVAVGSMLICTCGALKEQDTATDGTPRVGAKLYRFDYSGVVEGDTETVAMGNIGSVERKGDHLVVSIATTLYNKEKKENETRWIACEFTGKTADAVEKLAEKGKHFAAIGKLDGNKMAATTFVA